MNYAFIIAGGFLCIVFLAAVLFYFRRRKIIADVRRMSQEEKQELLDRLIRPFGYCYDDCQDIFSTVLHPPQRAYGYTALYDEYAPQFGMIFDCQPIYFDYGERTWMVEFWKGQYGVCRGCEVGLYVADGLVPSLLRKSTLFKSVEDRETMPMSIRLCCREEELARLKKRHWWLTAFEMGAFARPEDLTMEVGITFPDSKMQEAFVRGVKEQDNVRLQPGSRNDLQVQLLFDACTSCSQSFLYRLRKKVIQWQNHVLCRLFCRCVRPFVTGLEGMLYLYYWLPWAFRRIFCDKKRKKCRRKSCLKCRSSRKNGCETKRLQGGRAGRMEKRRGEHYDAGL